MIKENYSGAFEVNRDIEAAYNKVVARSEKYKIKENEFVDLYGEAEVQEDKKYIQEREEIFESKMSPEARLQKMRAIILEYILFEQSQLGEWFGENILAFKSSDYDDVKNGIDMITELQKKGNEKEAELTYLGLAIDISFGSELGKKFDRIKKEIIEGKLGEVKYFKSERSGKRKLTDLPHVVLAVDTKTVNDLIELWSNSRKDELSKHPAQLQIVHELIKQLKVFEQYARLVTKNEAITTKYTEVLQALRPLLAEKEKQFHGHEGNLFDAGYQHVVNGLSGMELEIKKASPQESDAERRRKLMEKFSYLNKNKQK